MLVNTRSLLAATFLASATFVRGLPAPVLEDRQSTTDFGFSPFGTVNPGSDPNVPGGGLGCFLPPPQCPNPPSTSSSTTPSTNATTSSSVTPTTTPTTTSTTTPTTTSTTTPTTSGTVNGPAILTNGTTVNTENGGTTGENNGGVGKPQASSYGTYKPKYKPTTYVPNEANTVDQ
ncbi:hypothetical protein P691DRAFT_812005 [Macrolepiota fuliginosa MF-IS2]|uniref:Uncharacterized protein n=1 Tax=Macrolepiota fuliginosa MF-IS2 TaxID=1400762 RepID=A0A9P5XE68_9AGAR|nr:hypothetical protein P691DRAFT_812005 [Macrolepiota fuliginosa MF-IS2]